MVDICICNARIMDPASGTDIYGSVSIRDGKITYDGFDWIGNGALIVYGVVVGFCF